MKKKSIFLVTLIVLASTGCQTLFYNIEDGVPAVLRANRKSLNDCWCQSTDWDQKPDGVLQMKFQVDHLGKVSKVEVVESNMGSPELEACFSDAYSRMTFPPSAGGRPTLFIQKFEILPSHGRSHVSRPNQKVSENIDSPKKLEKDFIVFEPCPPAQKKSLQ